MRLRLIRLVVAAALLGSAGFLLAQDVNVGDLAKELAGEKAAAPRAAEQLDAAYAKVLDALMPDLGADDANKRATAVRTVERIAFHASRPGAEAERAACAKAVAAHLGPDGAPLARTWLIRQLERLGQAEAVPALAKALDDKDTLVRESARRALSKNPSPEASATLRQALGTAGDVAWRLAILNGLVQRQDPADLPVLLKEAASDIDDFRSAALRGLAKIGDKAAVEPLAAAMTKGAPAARQSATDSYLLLAEVLVSKGDKATALGMYQKLLASPGYLKCAAIVGLGRAGGVAELPVIFAALADPDVKLRGACIEALVLLPGSAVTAAIGAKVKDADTEIKPALLQTLARRGDKTALPVLVAAAEDANEAVRVEAVRGLGVLGDATVVPLLLKAAATTGKPQDAAREALQQLKGDDVSKALLGAMEVQDPKARLEVIRALAMRRVAAATPALLKSAGDADAALRNQSLQALGSVAPTDALPAVADLVVKAPDDGTRQEAANALIRIAGREADAQKRSEPVLTALAGATGPAKLALLGALGRIGGPQALAAVRTATQDNDPKVKDAAIRALADWPDVSAADDLLNIAKTATDETQQVLAIRGYIRVVRLESRRAPAESARMLAAGLEAAKRPGEKKQALGGLAEVRHVTALNAVTPCLDDPALQAEASQAAVRIGRDLADSQPAAVKAAMQKVLEVCKNADVRKQAQDALDRAEAKLQQARPAK